MAILRSGFCATFASTLISTCSSTGCVSAGFSDACSSLSGAAPSSAATNDPATFGQVDRWRGMTEGATVCWQPGQASQLGLGGDRGDVFAASGSLAASSTAGSTSASALFSELAMALTMAVARARAANDLPRSSSRDC